jgi:hypothetical protein
MPSVSDYPARGKIIETRDKKVVFHPAGTNYQLHLTLEGEPLGASERPIDGIIRVEARKLWTVPSGGNFIQPIFGEPRIIQGRVKWLDERLLVVQAATNFVVQIPSNERAIDLANGVIEAGALVNVTALPGATFELRVPAQSKSLR